MMNELELICGDPNNKVDKDGKGKDRKAAATYSRFVIPFAYKLNKGSSDKTHKESADGNQPINYAYQEIDDTKEVKNGLDNKWRREYFTSETENVIFENTKWFQLKFVKNHEQQEVKDVFPKDITFNLNGKPIYASFSAPKLILFEFPKDNLLKPRKELWNVYENVSNNLSETEEWDLLQVGFLIVEIFFKDNYNKPTLDDLLRINELFRYFGPKFDDHYTVDKLDNLLGNSSLATLRLEEKVNYNETEFFSRWLKLLNISIYEKCGCKWTIKHAYQKDEHTKVKQNREHPKNTYPDNRAYVWTCAIMKNGAEDLWQFYNKQHGEDVSQDNTENKTSDDYLKAINRIETTIRNLSGEKKWKASNYGHWIKLLNVDLPEDTPKKTHNSREFEKEWANKHTYHRWEEWGTYYGFTPHSGAVIAPDLLTSPIWQHFGQMYFDQVLLLLYLRVVLFRFSARLGEISREARDNHNHAKEKWAKDFQELRWQFALFTNLYQFPLLSNQQQGIELYTLARDCMEVDELFNEVQEEIHSSHDYLSQHQNQEQTQITTLLTVVATIGLLVSIIFAFLSLSIWQTFQTNHLGWFLLVAFFVAVFFYRLLERVIYCSRKIAEHFRQLAEKGKEQ